MVYKTGFPVKYDLDFFLHSINQYNTTYSQILIIGYTVFCSNLRTSRVGEELLFESAIYLSLQIIQEVQIFENLDS